MATLRTFLFHNERSSTVTDQIVLEANIFVMLTCHFRPAVQTRRPTTVRPAKATARLARLAQQDPAATQPCVRSGGGIIHRAASSTALRSAPTEGSTRPHQVCMLEPWVRLRLATVPRTQPSSDLGYSIVWPSAAGQVATSEGVGSRKPAGATTITRE